MKSVKTKLINENGIKKRDYILTNSYVKHKLKKQIWCIIFLFIVSLNWITTFWISDAIFLRMKTFWQFHASSVGCENNVSAFFVKWKKNFNGLTKHFFFQELESSFPKRLCIKILSVIRIEITSLILKMEKHTKMASVNLHRSRIIPTAMHFI